LTAEVEAKTRALWEKVWAEVAKQRSQWLGPEESAATLQRMVNGCSFKARFIVLSSFVVPAHALSIATFM